MQEQTIHMYKEGRKVCSERRQRSSDGNVTIGGGNKVGDSVYDKYKDRRCWKLQWHVSWRLKKGCEIISQYQPWRRHRHLEV